MNRTRIACLSRPLAETLEPRRLLATLPPGFVEQLVTTSSNLSAPTAMAFAPTGQLFVLEQGGAVKLVRSNGTTHTALGLTVDSAGERGLLGITFAPDYDGAGPNADYVYLYYTTPRTSATNPSHNRISRFTVSGAGTGTPTFGGEQIIRELPPEDEDNNLATNGNTNHNGGAIHFGPDGKLYVAVGDHNYDNLPQSAHVSQVLDIPFGKMLRLNPDGSNPTDNPFYSGSAGNWRGAVWALGLRNPYTFAIQPGTGRVFINDVGESAWEEINDGVAGANYGWAGSNAPLWEGFEGNSTPWANYHDPIMAYDQSDASGSPAGCAITGGAFYPAGGSFGSAYAGKYFFADFCGSFIRVFDPSNPGTIANPDRSSAFASNLAGGAPVDLKVDAAGNLYYLSRGATGEIYRIQFQAPAITQQPTDRTTQAGQDATFTVAASGGAPLSFQWQKLAGGIWSNIAGATSSSFTVEEAVASDAGQYRAIVSNSAGTATSTPATLTVNVPQPSPAFAMRVNFQDSSFNGVAGYFSDKGFAFADRGNGRSYGWDTDNTDAARNRNAAHSPAEIFDTLNHMQKSGGARVWEVAVPNGTYNVRLVAGDPSFFNGVYRMNVEGELVLSGAPTSQHRWIEGRATVTVSDGRLTLSNASGAVNNKIAFLEFASASADTGFKQFSGPYGIVSIEAESHHSLFDRSGKTWSFVHPAPGFSAGGAMQATPNSGTLFNAGFTTTSPRMDYRINFTKTGLHYVWIRGRGLSGTDDSIHVGLNGQAINTSDRIAGLTSDWSWTNATMDGSVAVINVTQTGLQTLNLWMREDGVIVDKILLTTMASYTPTGVGPAESPIVNA